MPFFDPFWALVARSLKIAKVPRCFKNKHLGAFQASEAIFFEGLLSVDFGAEKALRRYVYNGFSDFFVFVKREGHSVLLSASFLGLNTTMASPL